MQRVALAIALLLGVIAGGGGVYLWQSQKPTGLDDAAVRTVVAEVLAERDAMAKEAPAPINVPSINAATLDPMIESYLIGNPRILQRMSEALETEVRTAEAAAAKAAIAEWKDAIYDEPGQIVICNPNGDVTLVEMFDYNCGYCRGALPDLATLIAEDPNLRVVLKEFPILSQESVDAARIAVLVSKQPVDYWAFHEALFTGRGKVTKDSALAAAKDLGLNPITLELDMQSDEVTAVIQKSYDIAKALSISGTPTYIIGDELIPGAVGVDELRERIKNMRACGATQCPPSG
jgi:protein-disulfide isomerase